jgi:thioredoxin-like negative regulator of GroEL
MRGSARLVVVLMVAVAHAGTALAAATARFIPADPRFVVADVRNAVPDAELAGLISRWRADPAADTASIALGEAFLERARKLRQPLYVGRAEAVLEAAAARPGASAATLRLYAQTLQYRHDFQAAETLLGRVIAAAPGDTAARVQRASLRLVRGDFTGAAADCARSMSAGGAQQAIAIACLAQVHAASGRLIEAQALLATFPLPPADNAPVRAYWLTVRAELYERANMTERAIADYRSALALTPENDAIRASLADALLARGQRGDARSLLAVERASLPLLVRQVACANVAERDVLQARAASLLELETARGDAGHRREAALLALDAGDSERALVEAEANFESQKELADVRVLARAAVAARDAVAQRRLADWLRSTGYRDAVTENVLGSAARG